LKPDGDPKTSNPLIDDLKKAGVFNELKARQLRAWADIHNKAAHGEFGQFHVPLENAMPIQQANQNINNGSKVAKDRSRPKCKISRKFFNVSYLPRMDSNHDKVIQSLLLG
jgi:hypothetical protein